MEEPRLKHEIGDDAPAPARAAVAADLDGSTEAPLTKLKIRDEAPAPAPEPPAAVVAVGGGGGGGLQHLVVELGVRDRRLQAACFFLLWGCCVLIYGTVLNPSTNWEHILVGFVVLTIGAGLAILTLAGDGAARAAARVEEFLRGFF